MNIYISYDDGFQDVNTEVTGTGSNTSYLYGVCFTPNKNCSITKVKFLGDTPLVGTLKIAQGNYASSNTLREVYTITASDNPSCIYELSTPYQLTANTNYVVSFIRSSNGPDIPNNNTMSSVYPVVCDDITYNYGTYSNTNSQMKGYDYVISGLMISTS